MILLYQYLAKSIQKAVPRHHYFANGCSGSAFHLFQLHYTLHDWVWRHHTAFHARALFGRIGSHLQ